MPCRSRLFLVNYLKEFHQCLNYRYLNFTSHIEILAWKANGWNSRYNSLHETWGHAQAKSTRFCPAGSIVLSSTIHGTGTTQNGLQVFQGDDAVDESWVINKDGVSWQCAGFVFGPKTISSPEVMTLACRFLNGTVSSTFSSLDVPWSCNSWQVSKLSSQVWGRASLFVSNTVQLPAETGTKCTNALYIIFAY